MGCSISGVKFHASGHIPDLSLMNRCKGYRGSRVTAAFSVRSGGRAEKEQSFFCLFGVFGGWGRGGAFISSSVGEW